MDEATPDPVPVVYVPPADYGAAARKTRYQIFGGVFLVLLSVGVSLASCVGQSFNRRQANALEAIQHTLEDHCAAKVAP